MLTLRIIPACITACTVVALSPASTGEEWSLPNYDDVVTVPVTIDGREVPMLLDSGASTVFLHSSYRHQLSGQAGVNAGAVSFHDAPAMRIGEATWTCPDPVGCVDHGPLRAATGRPIAGALGIPFFRNRLIELDFDRSRIVVHPASEKATLPDDALPLTYTDTGLPMIQITLGADHTESVIVDTGFTGSLSLNWSAFHELNKRGELQEESPRQIATIRGFHSVRHGTVALTTIGPHQLHELSVDSSQESSRIGLGLLRRFHSVIDVQNDKLHLTKGKRFDLRDPKRSSGFALIRPGDDYIVVAVQNNSRASSAGVRPGDILMRVNDQEIAGLPIAEIAAIVKRQTDEGQSTTLEIRRNGLEQQIVLPNP